MAYKAREKKEKCANYSDGRKQLTKATGENEPTKAAGKTGQQKRRGKWANKSRGGERSELIKGMVKKVRLIFCVAKEQLDFSM